MTHEELQAYARRQPFRPFRIVLSMGETHDIRHPDLIMVGRRSAFIGTTNDPAGTVYDLGRLIDLLHVAAIDELAQASSSGNGGRIAGLILPRPANPTARHVLSSGDTREEFLP